MRVPEALTRNIHQEGVGAKEIGSKEWSRHISEEKRPSERLSPNMEMDTTGAVSVDTCIIGGDERRTRGLPAVGIIGRSDANFSSSVY